MQPCKVNKSYLELGATGDRTISWENLHLMPYPQLPFVANWMHDDLLLPLGDGGIGGGLVGSLLPYALPLKLLNGLVCCCLWRASWILLLL